MIDKKTLLKNLKQEFEDAKNAKAIIDKKIVEWKDRYEAKPLGNEKKGKSQYVSKDIKKLLKWQLPIILEPFVNTTEIVRTTGTTPQSVQKAYKIEKLLNYQFCRQFDRYNFMKKAIKLLQKEGKVIIRTGWKIKTEKQIVQTPAGSIEVEVPVVNKPDAIIRKNENVFIDPTADGEEPEFIIERYETTISNLRENKHWYNQKAVEKLAQKLISNDDDDDTALGVIREAEEYERGGSDDFEPTDKARTKVTVYEYWGKYDINEDGIAENIVCAWADDVILKLEDNPYPDNELPFVMCDFDAEPFMNYGDSAIEDLIDNSQLITIVKRGLIENMASANMGQKGIAKGALDTINKKKFYNGENFEYNKNFGDPWQDEYHNIGQTPLEMLQILENDNESLSGVTKNAIGERTPNLSATQANQIESATQRRMLDIVRNIAENLVKPVLRKWLAYDMEFMSPQEFIYITGEEPIIVDKQDLDGSVHLEMQVTTQAVDDQKAKQLAFLLQTSQQSQDPEITKMLYVKLLKLNKMFEEAKALEEYQPKPDPTQQQTVQLQLAKLQTEIENLKVKALENQADIKLKLAKAKEIGSKADLNDLDYVDKATGQDHARELDKIGANALAKPMTSSSQ